MPVIDYIDGLNRDIYLHADTVGGDVHPIDIYREMRTLRRTDESLRRFNLFLEAKGYDTKGPGKYTERYVVCLEGTRIVPYDTSHTLTVTGTIITDDGQEGVACFDRAPLTATTVVDINYVPPQVEVITVVSGSGVTAQDKTDIINGTWAHASAVQLVADVSFIKDIEGGRWEIVANQMIFYADDNTTEVARFNLFDAGGSPTSDVARERVRV